MFSMFKLHVLVLNEVVHKVRTWMLTRACCVQTREREYIHDLRSLQYLCSCFTLIEGPLKTQGGCVCVGGRVSVGQIYRFCHKPRGRLLYSLAPLSVCDTAVRQTSPKTPLGPCTRLRRASGTCRRWTAIHVIVRSNHISNGCLI